MSITLTPELWVAIMMFLSQQMDALFRDLEAMTEEEREIWRQKQKQEYEDHMAWLEETRK